MYVSSKLFAATAAVLAITVSASAQGRRPFDLPPARTAQDPAGALTIPSNASPVAVLAQYLRDHGRDEATVRSIVEVSRGAARNGITNARYEQRAGGLPVYGTYAKAAFNDRGELVHLIENFVPAGAVARARVSAQQAIDAAVKNLYPELGVVPAGFFRSAPTATPVAVPQANGSLTAGYTVQTWTQKTNQLDITVVDGDGTIVGVESRTNNDRYNVFTENPNATPQTIKDGPGGWLSGAQKTTNIQGNNANAYLDATSDNVPDAGGTDVTTGDFLAAANLADTPSSTTNRAVAVQNLFYLNNVIHDELYRHGFTEAAGNFQNDNFGNGGAGSDSVLAEAQDGGGTDNANFSTPTDGSHPRMQMYLWTGRGTHQVAVGSNVYAAAGAEFGATLSTTGVSGGLAVASPADACTTLTGSLSGKIAVIDRGACDFTVKVRNAQNAGAAAAIIVNNQGDTILVMGGSDRKVRIGAVFVGQTDGGYIKAAAGATGTVRKSATDPLQIDGDVDSDIVFHEYCHGLTWRMIGSMSGAMAGAIGEGMSDVCAILLNGDDVVGEYAFSDAKGIRRDPYANYPRTYADMTSGEVHNDGELYGAIGWRMRELFIAQYGDAALATDKLLDYLVDGMNYTAAGPTYEQMRDGILTGIGNADATGTCNVWRAFAKYGVGVGASASVRGKRVTITESFQVPAACPAP